MKAVLVIDMPEACWEDCPCEYDMRSCQVLDRDLEYVTAGESRPDWCPLRPLPEPEQESSAREHLCDGWNDFVRGWNACLEAITGGKEE